VGIGKDDTLFATAEGTVEFVTRFGNKKYINVHPLEVVADSNNG
jgi:ribosomal protein L27